MKKEELKKEDKFITEMRGLFKEIISEQARTHKGLRKPLPRKEFLEGLKNSMKIDIWRMEINYESLKRLAPLDNRYKLKLQQFEVSIKELNQNLLVIEEELKKLTLDNIL